MDSISPVNAAPLADGEFELFDLRVVVDQVGPRCTCNMAVGDAFMLQGGKLSVPAGKSFCVYAMQSVLPLLPAKQRRNHPADWMETDAICTCPDPACGLLMRIERTATRVLRHDDVSATPWTGSPSA